MFANRKSFNRFAKDERGTIIMMLAITLPLLVAVVGLSVDVGNWYYAERKAQTAVDSGAVAAAMTLYNGGYNIEAEESAFDSAKRNEFEPGTGRGVKVQSPPSSGAFAGDLTAVEVTGTEIQPVYLAGLIFKDEVKVETRAVAAAINLDGPVCVLGLDSEMAGAVEFTGTANTELGCSIHSNSYDSESLTVWGDAEVDAVRLSSSGDMRINKMENVSHDTPHITWMQPIKDPYGPEGLALSVPSSPKNCLHNNKQLSSTSSITLNPGRYCGGLRISSSNVTFNPGVYIIDGDDFRVQGGSTLEGDGVTFVLTGTGGKWATVKFAGDTQADLTAPTSGTYEGVLFFGDPDAPSYQGKQLIGNEFLGGSNLELTGAVYIPNQKIVYTGGGTLSGSCIQLIGKQVSFNGNGKVGFDCPANMDIPEILAVAVKLVE